MCSCHMLLKLLNAKATSDSQILHIKNIKFELKVTVLSRSKICFVILFLFVYSMMSVFFHCLFCAVLLFVQFYDHEDSFFVFFRACN